MKSISVRKDSYFTNSVIADLVFILIRIFNNEELPAGIQNVYTEADLSSIKGKYRFLGEIIRSFPMKGYEMLEFLLIIKDLNDIQDYKNQIVNLKDEEFFYLLYGKHIDITLINSALKNEDKLNYLYTEYNFVCSNYLALKSLFSDKKLFLEEFFSCSETLSTKKFILEYGKIADLLYSNYDAVEAGLKLKNPLEFSESIMGKTFKNRGPYQKFIFIPSCFIPGKAVRFFERNQILIYSPELKKISNKDITRILKIISDDTRFEIIELLSKNKTMNGKDIANAVQLSTPTISHHIDQLKEAGFINEERVKNSKYYSINSNSVKEFISCLSNIFRNIE